MISYSRKRPGPISWKPIAGSVTAPHGFTACGVSAGIKKQGKDLALVVSSSPASGAAVFTSNCVQAAPVVLSRKHLGLSGGRVRGVLLNSGCANACTGVQGMKDAVLSARCLASLLKVDRRQVLVASTGVIGTRLPIRKILKTIPAAFAALSSLGGDDAMRAIMTTDTHEKTFAVESLIGGERVRIGGMAKGAGMIHPRLATMLAVITTDLAVSPSRLKGILRRVADRTFNCLTVDGDTSTNDMVLLIANGVSNARMDPRSSTHFEQGLEIVCRELAKSIARDGEGATKFVEIVVSGAPNFTTARQVAKAIAHSPLVKTALSGEQLNWGRILCAAGYSGVEFNPEKVTLNICGMPVFRNGSPVTANRARAERALKRHDLQIELDLRRGHSVAHVWTCDLSREYVNINACYLS